jgi:hypothetical protein
MEDNIGQIVQIIGLLMFLGILLVPFFLFFIYVFFQNSKRQRIREPTSTAYGHVIGGAPTIPVRYASEPRFRSWLKVFPWEGAGLLVPANGVVTFVGEHLNGAPLNLQFAPNTSLLTWLGKCPWPNGAVSWFAVESQGQKHYFTSETGPFVFGSNNSTKAAFDECNRSFALAVLNEANLDAVSSTSR